MKTSASPPRKRKAVAEPLAIRFDAPGGRERHVLGHNDHIGIRNLFKQRTTRYCGLDRVFAKAGAPARFPALDRMMKDVGGEHDPSLAVTGELDTEHPRRVSRRRSQVEPAAEIGIHLGQL